LVAEPQEWQASTWHLTNFVTLPAGCASVRATVSPAAEIRESPQLACDIRLVFRNAEGVQIPGGGAAIVARPVFADDEPTPVTGHEQGEPPGVFPATLGAFAYVMEDSPAVEQVPYAITAGVEFRLSHLQAIYVTAAVTLEAFAADGNPLEIA
jgi:hypothetical protein